MMDVESWGVLRLATFLKANTLVATVLAIIVLVHLSNQYDRYLFSVARVPFVDYDSYDFALLVGPIFTAVNSIAGVFLSLAGDLHPVRLLCGACVLWNVSTAMVAASRRFWQVALARIGQGIGEAACSPFATSILRDHFGPDLIGSAIGVYFVGLYAGFSLSMGLGTLTDDTLGWRFSYLLAAALGLIIAAAAFWLVPEKTTPSSLHEQVKPEDDRGNTPMVSTSSSPCLDEVGNGSIRAGARSPPLIGDFTGAHVQQTRASTVTAPPQWSSPVRENSSLSVDVHAGERTPLLSTPLTSLPGLLSSSPSKSLQSLDATESRYLQQRHRRVDVGRISNKVAELSATWFRSPSLLLVCVGGGVRDAGGFIFGYYLATYFSPLMEPSPSSKAPGAEDCMFSFDKSYSGDQVCDEDFPWCVGGTCSRLSGSPWHDRGMSSMQLEWFISWVPLVAGSLGAMMGGIVSDRVAQSHGAAGRLWVVVLSNALASPFAAGVLLAPYPWCFACLFGVELLGEMWIGVVLAVVISLVPRRIRVTSIALYNFIITNLSGLLTTVVPLLRRHYDVQHTFRFAAEPLAGAASSLAVIVSSVAGQDPQIDQYAEHLASDWHHLASIDDGDNDEVEFTVSETGSRGLRIALLWMYPGLYLLSSVFCMAAALALRREQRKEMSSPELDFVEGSTHGSRAPFGSEHSDLDADDFRSRCQGVGTRDLDVNASRTIHLSGRDGENSNCRGEAAVVPLLSYAEGINASLSSKESRSCDA